MNCPVCDAPDVKIVDDHFECDYCSSIMPHNLLVCPSCRNPNPIDSENCTVCGEPLTLVSQVIIRHTELDLGPYRLRQAREQAAQIQESGERASQQRLRDLQEADSKRIQAAREAEMIRRKEQIRLMQFALGIILVFILVVIILLIQSAGAS
jgi:hypothetical protein